MMGKYSKLLIKILNGQSDNNIEFSELCVLLNKLGFKVRIKGSHHIFYHDKMEEIINIQEMNGKSKQYQVKQIRELILKYKLEISKDEKY